MKPATTYEDVCAYMARMYYGDSGQEIPPGPNKKVRMVGLLFARPDVPLAEVEVVPNLDYFYYRSGKHIDFFCAGYDGYTGRDETEGYRKINKEPELKWGFSERMFIRFMEDKRRGRLGNIVEIVTSSWRTLIMTPPKERCALTSSITSNASSNR